MSKKILCGVLFFIIFCTHPSFTFASNFTVSSSAVYTVMETGVTHAEFAVTLKNNTSTSYASSYKLHVGFENIQNVHAYDDVGVLQTKIDKTQEKTIIEILFNKKNVGINKSNSFHVAFDTPDVVQQDGTIKEVNIPSLAKNSEFSSFSLQLKVPKSFGKATYVKPEPVGTNSSFPLTFSMEQLKKSGISIAFGDKQIYTFTLRYNLKNGNFFPVKTDIALPPSTNYQEVYYNSLDPLPQQVTKDADGNWIAQYLLKPTEALTVTAKGTARIFLYPRREEVTDKELSMYLKEQNYWETSSDVIKKKAQNLKTPQEIYDYVVNTLHYDYGRVSSNKPRLGAVAALQNSQSAVCLEFTDLFIALARAAGIPAREVDGFANTKDSARPLSKVKDILHAWPQYYDKTLETWVMVDPTWGNTTGGVDYFNTLDFDHFAFVVKGKSSEYPIPAGGYKLTGKEAEQDVEISFATQEPQAVFDSKAEIHFPKEVMAGFPISGTILLRNNGNTILPAQSIHVTTQIIQPNSSDITSKDIPPFGYAQIPISFHSTSFLTKNNETLTIRVGGKSAQHEMVISPFVFNAQVIGGGIVFGILTVVISKIALRARRISV